MTAVAKPRATIEDLYHVEGKAELVNGEIVLMSPTGRAPSRISFNIAVSLRQMEQPGRNGVAVPDNAGFLSNLPHRESFSPDAAWYNGLDTDAVFDDQAGMDFFPDAPVFAVEVRSKNDYGPSADRAILAKIRDYFDAGTLAVWDVDSKSPDVIKKYTPDAPDNPTIFRRGEIADAEPAVPGWRMPVDDLFA